MKQGEDHYVQCCQYGPAVFNQQSVKRGDSVVSCQHGAGCVGHNDYGQDYLVCRKAENEGGENYAVKSKRPTNRVKKACYVI